MFGQAVSGTPQAMNPDDIPAIFMLVLMSQCLCFVWYVNTISRCDERPEYDDSHKQPEVNTAPEEQCLRLKAH